MGLVWIPRVAHCSAIWRASVLASRQDTWMQAGNLG